MGWAYPHTGAVPSCSPVLSESRLLSLSRSAVLAEVASAEMSLHAIYIHEVSTWGARPHGPIAAPAPPLPCAAPWVLSGRHLVPHTSTATRPSAPSTPPARPMARPGCGAAVGL